MASINENAKLMKGCIGKTVQSIEDTAENFWHDPHGFIIRFTDGTAIEVSADMGQGVGYVETWEV